MIVTNRMQLWVEMPVFTPPSPEQAVFLHRAMTVLSSLLWAFFLFIIVRAIVLNTRDRRARKRGRRILPPYQPRGEQS
jgi:hypothetical protein